MQRSTIVANVVGTIVAVLLTGAIAEVVVRWLAPTPRAQIVRARSPGVPGHDMTMVHGQPVWREPGTVERMNEDCQTEDSYDIALFGSSIFFGTSYGPSEVLSAHLQRLLDAGGDGPWCVMNYAQPAFISGNKLALAKDRVPAIAPELVIWELWRNEPGAFTMIDGDAYNLGRAVVDADGYPVAVPLPSPLHHWLFERSALWEYLTLALVPAPADVYEALWTEVATASLPAVRDAARASGGTLMVVAMPALDQPFSESVVVHDTKLRGYQQVRAWAASAGVPYHDVAAALVGEDVEALRHDPCCHLAPSGHRAVAEHLADWVRQVRATQER